MVRPFHGREFFIPIEIHFELVRQYGVQYSIDNVMSYLLCCEQARRDREGYVSSK